MATRSKNYDPQKRYIDVYNDFSGGINTAYTSTKLKENQFTELVNFDIDKIGQAVKRAGLKKFNIDGIALSQVIIDELKKQYNVSNDLLVNLNVKNSYSFFDGVRQVINFTTNIGVITVIFNQSFTGIEQMDNGTKLVLYYDEMIENVKFVKYNDKIICYCSRPKLMKTTTSISVKNNILDPRNIEELITVDKEEPISFYSWNPTNRNKFSGAVKGTLYCPIGWVRAYNWNKEFGLARNIDTPPNVLSIIKNKELKSKNETLYFNTHEMGDGNNKKIPLQYDFQNNFVDIEGSFEYIQNHSSGKKNVYIYKSLKYGNYDLIIDDVKDATDFLNFPIAFVNGAFHFGGCTKNTFYIWKINLNDLRNKNNNLQVIIKETVKSVDYQDPNNSSRWKNEEMFLHSENQRFFYENNGATNSIDESTVGGKGYNYEAIKKSYNGSCYGSCLYINDKYILSLPSFEIKIFSKDSGSYYDDDAKATVYYLHSNHAFICANGCIEYDTGKQLDNVYSNLKDDKYYKQYDWNDQHNWIYNPTVLYSEYNGVSIREADGTLYINDEKTGGIYETTPWGITYLYKDGKYGPGESFAKIDFKNKSINDFNNPNKDLLNTCNKNFSEIINNETGAWWYGLNKNVNQRLAKTIKELEENQRYFDNLVSFQAPLLNSNNTRLMSVNSNVGTNIIRSVDTQKYPFVYTKQTYDLNGLATQQDIDAFKNNLWDVLDVLYGVTFGNENPQYIERSIQIPSGLQLLDALVKSKDQDIFRTFYQGFPDCMNTIKFQSSLVSGGTGYVDDFYISTKTIEQSPNSFSINQRVGISLELIKAKVLITDNPVYFEPIQLSIPSCNDMKTSSYNLASFDDRGTSADNLRSDLKKHTDISPWLVQSIKQGGDGNKADANSYYLNSIIPVNQLVITPRRDSLFKLYYWFPDTKPKLLTKEISMPVDQYNNIFFNEKFDWKKFMVDKPDKKLPDPQKVFEIPYGDREWVVGWATCAYEGSGNSVNDITSAIIKTAVYSFIPSNNEQGSTYQTDKYYNDFLYTDKACVFASRVVLYGQSNRLFFSEINDPCYFPLLNVIELPTQEVIISCVEFGYYLIVSTANSKFIIRGRSFDKTSSNPISLDLISSDTGSFATKADRVNGNYLFFLDKTGIKYLANAYGTAEKEYNFKPIDMLINKKLPKGLKANDAVATTHNNKYYINFPNTKQMFIYDNELNAWTQYKGELMAFNDMYSQDGILYCVYKNSMDLYWFDKDTYVDGYVGIDGLWDEKTYGAIWKSKVGSIRDGIYQVGMPIHTVLITRPFVGVDDAHVKAYYDLDVLIRSNIPMNHVDIQTSIDRDNAYPTLQMPGGRTPGKNMLYYAHYIGDSRGIRYKKYQRKYPQAILNQISILNYSRLGGTDLNLHKVKIGGRKGYTCMVAVINTTPGSYSIESIKMNYQFRSSK